MPHSEYVFTVRKVSAESNVSVGHAFSVTGEATVGRGVDVDLRVDDITVSRRHAHLEVTEAGLTIEAASASNGVFVDGARVEFGATTTITDGTHKVQLGGVLFEVSPMAATRPVLEPMTLASAKHPRAPFLTIARDGDQCTVQCKGRFLDIHASAARALYALCSTPSKLVHEWDIQDAVGGPSNIQQLMSTIRRGIRLLIENGHVSLAEIRTLIEANSAGERLEGLAEMNAQQLLRRFVLSRRGHGYLICLAESDVAVEEVG